MVVILFKRISSKFNIPHRGLDGKDISFEMNFLIINDRIKVTSYDGLTNVFPLIKFFLKYFLNY